MSHFWMIREHFQVLQIVHNEGTSYLEVTGL